MNVSISGSPVFSNKAIGRSAYQILKLTDIEGYDTTKSAEFNDESFVGKMTTSIIGGEFSTDPTKYVADNYTVKRAGDNSEDSPYKYTVVAKSSLDAGVYMSGMSVLQLPYYIDG